MRCFLWLQFDSVLSWWCEQGVGDISVLPVSVLRCGGVQLIAA